MAKEKVFSEVLNLRVDQAMSAEIKRIGAQHGQSDSEAARELIEWGIRAHRAREAALLRLPYDSDGPRDYTGNPMELVIDARWVEIEYPDGP
jgi:hypothetical protein